MKQRRTTRLMLLVVVFAAVGLAIVTVGAFGPRVGTGDAPIASDRTTITERPVPPTGDPGPDPDVRWSNPVRGEPDGVTISGSDVATIEFDEVRVLDLATGAAKWRVRLPGLARAQAVITENRVVVGTREELVLLERAGGRRVGAVAFAEAEHLVVAEVEGRELVVAANLDGEIAGVDVASGTSLWSRAYDGAVVAPPAVDGGLVVANWDLGTDTELRVLSATSGDVAWDLGLGSASTPPAMAGGRVFVAAGATDADAVFVALDAPTGEPLWFGEFPAPWDQSAAPVVVGDTIYLLDRVGTVTAVDVASGQPRWRTRTHTSVLYGRMVANARTVIFQTFDDHVVALDRATGKVVLGTSEDAFPIDVEATDDILVVALRRGAPSRIEGRAAP